MFTINPFSSTGPLWTVREAGDLMLMVQHSSVLMVDEDRPETEGSRVKGR